MTAQLGESGRSEVPDGPQNEIGRSSKVCGWLKRMKEFHWRQINLTFDQDMESVVVYRMGGFSQVANDNILVLRLFH